MEITGRLIKILQEVRGESQRGPWVRGGFVIETDGDYPRQVAFTTFGEDRLAMVKSIPLNTPVVVNFNPESREYEGRWYTDLRCRTMCRGRCLPQQLDMHGLPQLQLLPLPRRCNLPLLRRLPLLRLHRHPLLHRPSTTTRTCPSKKKEE